MIESLDDTLSEDDRYETYYAEPSSHDIIEQYEQMLDAEWLDKPLRELLEYRVNSSQ